MKPKIPRRQICRSADPRFVINRPWGYHVRKDDPNATKAAAVNIETGKVILSERPGLDVYGNHYVGEPNTNEVGLYKIGNGLRARIRVPESVNLQQLAADYQPIRSPAANSRLQFGRFRLESIIGIAPQIPLPAEPANRHSLPKRPAGEVTRLLCEIREGHREVEPQLIELVYSEMRRLAGRYLRNERQGHTLQPTALVHEAYVRLRQTDALQCVDRGHFFALAASVMRHLLVDYGKAHRAGKRGGGVAPVSLDEALGIPQQDGGSQIADALNLSEALKKLAAQSKRVSSVVELRFLGGLSVEETAAELNLSTRTVKRDCTFARAWLRRELGPS